ncbi:helix-turn-helix domain-containing protein (plasmid) [Streptomyces poriferorum]|uniref:helix-turn-helix domain-containing protein n=1 Tax=Streptomyces poriferorum TaxID=2798799 RepID=UPI00273D3BA3|nr:helix-turn-helix domain-containing protein [Streptomyces sp. Alt1]WLQ53790.1 helix-turn-helix domain-containing protein [Streptomyces sp. Alt1]
MNAVAAPTALVVPSPRSSGSPVCGAVDVLPRLFVPEASQWLSTSMGRIASEGYSWMQAVHWVAGSGLYKPRRHRSHGPRSFGPTTVRVAQELAELFPCRPGIKYLVRRTGLSERSVEYHLGMLREAGLLAYVVRGTRVRGSSAQASEFARMIPPEFDAALGIRTVLRDEAAPAYTRSMTGIAEAGRELMAKLARKASRKVRKPRSKTSSKSPAKGARSGTEKPVVTAVSGEVRCTPMQVGSSASSSAGTTSSPPESKLASGDTKPPTPKKSKAKTGGRRLNRVGRRYQLARELTQELDWLRGCSVPRIAWVARGVADAGWTVTDVRGWLHLRGEAAQVRRGSGLLAVLLAGAETILDTPAKRADAIEQWRGAQEAARRHRIQQIRARTERYDGDWDGPTSQTIQRQVNEAFAAAFGPQPQAPAPDTEALPEVSGVDALEDDVVAQTRAEARQQLMVGDTSLITVAVDAMGREDAEQLYGADLVRRGLQLASGARSSVMTYGRR